MDRNERRREPDSSTTPLFELKNVSKAFGHVYALQNVNLKLFPGEVVSLVGDNGAGKSTLIKLIAGFHAPTQGEILVDGTRALRWDTRHARHAGIETVYQSRALTEQQSIASNVFMGRELVNRFGFIRHKQQRHETEQLMRRIGYTSKVWSPDSPVSRLSGGERQGVAMARAVHFKGRLITLDEPTTSMALSEVREVLEFIRRLRDEGRSILFVSHNIHDSYAVADRLVLLDRGRIMRETAPANVTVEGLIEELHHVRKAERA